LGPGRQLTATPGSVSTTFTIDVPGLAAQGYDKDCTTKGRLPIARQDSLHYRHTLDATDAVNCGDQNDQQTPPSALWAFNPSSQTGNCILDDFENLDVTAITFDPDTIIGVSGGSDSCGSCQRGSPLEGHTWPGTNTSTSHSAFGLNAMQPLNLQCWPKNDAFQLMPCGYQVLESTQNLGGNWPGSCDGLLLRSDLTDEQQCKTACRSDIFCAVWQFSAADNNDGTPQLCYHGSGYNCYTTSGTYVVNSERLQHGYVNVIVDGLTQHRITGLRQQFGENIAVAELRDATSQMEACKNICHSNIWCTVWQSYYNNGTSDELGCWLEDPDVSNDQGQTRLGHFLPYPLTTDNFADNGNEVYLTGGQFIEHHCPIPTLPTRPTTTTTTTTTPPAVQAPQIVTTAAPDESSFWNPWGMILVGAGLLASVVAAICFFNSQDPKPKAKRAIKPPKKDPPQPPAPPPAQPVVPLVQPLMVQPTIAQPLPMTTIPQYAQPTAVAQPMTTYAAPPGYRLP
jgi:hypothetical protein